MLQRNMVLRDCSSFKAGALYLVRDSSCRVHKILRLSDPGPSWLYLVRLQSHSGCHGNEDNFLPDTVGLESYLPDRSGPQSGCPRQSSVVLLHLGHLRLDALDFMNFLM